MTHMLTVQLPDLDEVYQRRLQARENVRAQLSQEALQQAMRRCLPYPCHQRYTAVAMLPRDTLVNRVLSSISARPSYWVLAAGALAAGTFAATKYARRSQA